MPLLIARRDQLYLYLEEPPTASLSLIDYWRSRKEQWPQLTKMAFDFLSVLAISSECKRIFLSCTKITTLETSRLSEDIL